MAGALHVFWNSSDAPYAFWNEAGARYAPPSHANSTCIMHEAAMQRWLRVKLVSRGTGMRKNVVQTLKRSWCKRRRRDDSAKTPLRGEVLVRRPYWNALLMRGAGTTRCQEVLVGRGAGASPVPRPACYGRHTLHLDGLTIRAVCNSHLNVSSEEKGLTLP